MLQVPTIPDQPIVERRGIRVLRVYDKDVWKHARTSWLERCIIKQRRVFMVELEDSEDSEGEEDGLRRIDFRPIKRSERIKAMSRIHYVEDEIEGEEEL